MSLRESFCPEEQIKIDISWAPDGAKNLCSPVQEAHVGEESILVLGVAELSEELLDILLGDLVTEVAEDVVKLSQHHGAVAENIDQSEVKLS